MRMHLCIALLGGGLLLGGSVSQALPRFAAETGAKCQSCHINPSGGGMRNAFGAQFGREELPVPAWSEDSGLEDLAKLLPSFLGVGADFRTLYVVRQIPDSTGKSATLDNEFFQMQGDIDFSLRVAKKVSLYLSKGLYSGFEVFGLFNLLPYNGHIKIGKFVPNYGLKMDDHTAFIRMYTGFSASVGRPEITGIEAAVAPGPMTIAGGVYNATDGFGATGGSQKAYLGRAEGIFDLGKKVFFGLGANVFRREQAGGSVTLSGAFGSLGMGRFTLIGEGDFVSTAIPTRTITGALLYVEANYAVVDGVQLKAAYDFYDPDKDVKSGSTSRYSLGAEFFPIGGVEVRPVYRFIIEDPVDVKNNEFDLVFHIYL
jgi:hypothetical protein